MHMPIESLEYRRLLTSFVVDTITDDAADAAGTIDGEISLREAIIAANTNAAFGDAPAGSGADVITFSAEAETGPIKLNNGELTISESLTIDGQTRTINIDGQNTTRIFNVTTAAETTLKRLNLIKGQADRGGAIALSATGKTALDFVNIGNSTATGQGGGAIYNAGQTLVISGGTLSENKATGVSGSGGGLLSDAGNVEIYDTRIIGNVANRAGGGIEQTVGKLRLERVELGGEQLSEGNIAGPEGSANPGNGGGYHSTGATDVTIIGGTIKNNIAAREGGGLWNSATSTMRVIGGTGISFNEGRGAAADDGGGGIFNNGGTLVVEFATITNNKATGALGSGSGLFSTAGNVSVVRSTFGDNLAPRAGGGIELIAGTLDFKNSRLLGNVAGSGTANPGNGGGIHSTGAAVINVIKSRVSNNVAASEGGGLWNSATGKMTVVGTLVDGNRALGTAADNGGGGLFNNGGTVIADTTSFDDNRATGTAGSGGGLFSVAGDVWLNRTQFNKNIANRAGGAIEVIDGNVIFQRSLMYDNVAGPEGTAAPGNGGGIHSTGTAKVTVSKSTVERNIAALEGGGLWNAANGEMIVVGSAISRNVAKGATANDGGGGIFNNGGEMTIDYTTVALNKATGAAGSGGGLAVNGGEVTLFKSTLERNEANRAGGGVEVFNGGDVSFNQVVLNRNVAGPSGTAAPGNGGGLHVTGAGSNVNFVRSWARENRAAREGGGLWNDVGSTLTVTGSSVTDNIASGAAADDGGGGIFENGGTLVVEKSSFIGRNKAEGALGSGGGLFLREGTVATVSDSRIERNSTVRWGGGIFNDAQITLNNSRVVRNFAGVTGGGIFTDAGATTDLNSTAVTGNSPNNLAGSGAVT